MDDSLEQKSVILDLALDLLAEAADVDKSAITKYLEGHGLLAPQVINNLLSMAAERGCQGVVFEVVDTPHIGYHALLRLIAELNVNLSSFLRWFTPAGVRVDRHAGTYQVVNPFNEPITPILSTSEGVKSYIRELIR